MNHFISSICEYSLHASSSTKYVIFNILNILIFVYSLQLWRNFCGLVPDSRSVITIKLDISKTTLRESFYCVKSFLDPSESVVDVSKRKNFSILQRFRKQSSPRSFHKLLVRLLLLGSDFAELSEPVSNLERNRLRILLQKTILPFWRGSLSNFVLPSTHGKAISRVRIGNVPTYIYRLLLFSVCTASFCLFLPKSIVLRCQCTRKVC